MEKKPMEEMELLISRFLMVGVLLSAGIIIVGFVLLILTGNSGYPNNTYPTSPVAIFQGLFALKSYAIILTGLLILILTPFFRVGASIFLYLKEKDYLYAKITSLVFVILILSFLLGKVE